jgi:hypothetical protein
MLWSKFVELAASLAALHAEYKQHSLFVHLEWQPDGDLHLRDVYALVKEKFFVRKFTSLESESPVWTLEPQEPPAEFTWPISSLEAIVACPSDTVIGSPPVPSSFPVARPTAAADLAFEPVVLKVAPTFFSTLASWYWNKVLYCPVHRFGPPVHTWLSTSGAQSSLTAWLQYYGVEVGEQVAAMLARWEHFLDCFAEFARMKVGECVAFFGLEGFFPGLANGLLTAASVLHSAVFVPLHVLAVLPTVLKLVAVLLQDFTEVHGPEYVYRQVLLAGELNFAFPTEDVPGLPSTSRRVQTRVSPRVLEMNREAAMLNAVNVAEQQVVNRVSSWFDATLNEIQELPPMVLPESTEDAVLEQFQDAFAEFNVVRGINTHSHPRLHAIRTAFRRRANEHLSPRNRPVRLVGGGYTEINTVPRVTHNCAPVLSGRDDYRHFKRHADSRAVYARFSHNHRFENCNHPSGASSVVGADVYSFFSAHDIHPAAFVREMAASGSTTAVVALHLPFPLLDRRTPEYTDEVCGMTYVLEGGRVRAYTLEGHDAGYDHSFETLHAWMYNLPKFANAHVQLETLSQLGTSVLLVLTLGEGPQECVPTVWSCQKDDFYILPELLDGALRDGAAKHFPVPARRFESLVAYVSTLDPLERTVSHVSAKLRGMMAEIRVGIHRVEPRWYVALPQFYSLIQHSLIAHDVYHTSTMNKSKELRAYYSRVFWRSGKLWQRYVQRSLDLLTWRCNGELDVTSNSGFVHSLFKSSTDHTQVYNPYQRAGVYKLCPSEFVGSSGPASSAVSLSFASASVLATAFWSSASLVLAPVRLTASLVPSATAVASCFFPKPRRSTWREVERMARVWRDVPVARSRVLVRSVHPPVVPSQVPLPPGSPFDSCASLPLAVGSPSGPVAELPAPVGVGSPVPVSAGVVEREEPAVPGALSVSSYDPFGSSPSSSSASLRSFAQPAAAQAAVRPPSPVPRALPPVAPAALADDFSFWLEQKTSVGAVTSVNPALWSVSSPRDISFNSPLYPVRVQHPADTDFAARYPKAFRWSGSSPSPPVLLPTNGGVELLNSFFFQSTPTHTHPVKRFEVPKSVTMRGSRPLQPKAAASLLVDAYPTSERAQAIYDKSLRFSTECLSFSSSPKPSVLAVLGPAMSAKSTLVRSYIASHLVKTAVVVPSNALAASWSTDSVRSFVTVATRQSLFSRSAGYTLGVVDEVFCFTEFELMMHLRAFWRCGVKSVLLLGDESQRDAARSLPVNHPVFGYSLLLHTSLGMPLDAHGLMLRYNRLDHTLYTTTGTRSQSILFVNGGLLPTADLHFRPHGDWGQDDAPDTIGTIQGKRSRVSLFRFNHNAKKQSWITVGSQRRTVAVTRHKDFCVVDTTPAGALLLCFDVQPPLYSVVNASRAQLSKTLSPDFADDLFSAFTSSKKLAKHLPLLRAALSDPLALDGHHITVVPPDVVPVERRAVAGPVLRAEIVNLCLSNTNFELPDPVTLDLVVDKVLRDTKFRPVDPPEFRKDVRNDVENSHLLAAIHSNRSAFDCLKNVVDRQIATTKSSRLKAADLVEGVKLYTRFCECFVAKSSVVLETAKAAAWLVETEDAALRAISREVLDSSRYNTVQVEFKTQSKAKPVPGFAATLPYGQAILANEKAFNAYFASVQPAAYLNLSRIMREGVFLDYGMSDDALSSRLRRVGAHAELNGEYNVQADLSKQDSSHTASSLYAFLLVLKSCGLAQEQLDYYFAYARSYQIASRGADGLRSTVSYNLGSGDPLTLARNDIMQLMGVAAKFLFADRMVIVEKGDDVHGVIRSLAPHPLSNTPFLLQTKWKLDYGSVGYHAGRFHNGKRYLVDPFRAFLKHMTRLSDSNVPNHELYTSYVSRATDYTDSEVEFLVAAGQLMYPYSASQCAAIVNFMLALRQRSVFEAFSKVAPRRLAVVVDAERSCAVQCVRALFPGRPRSFYRLFRTRTLEDLVSLFDSHSIPYVVSVPGVPLVSSQNVILLDRTHARLVMTFNDSRSAHLPLLS